MAFAYGSDVGIPSYNDIVAFARKSGISFSVTSTTGGSHVQGSYHYSGNAVDLASSAGLMQQLAAWLYGYAPYILELIHSGGPGYFVKNGQKVNAAFYGAATVSQHYNHVHIAMTESGLLAAGAGSGGTSATPQLVDSKPVPGCIPVLPVSAFMIGAFVVSAGESIARLVHGF